MNTLKRYQLIATYRYNITCAENDFTFRLEIYQYDNEFKGIVFQTEFYALSPAFPLEGCKQPAIAHEETEIRDHFFAEHDLIADSEQQVIKLFEEQITQQFLIALHNTNKETI